MIAVKVHTILHLVGALGGRQLTADLPEGTTLAECLRRLAAQLGEPAQGVLFSTPEGALAAPHPGAGQRTAAPVARRRRRPSWSTATICCSCHPWEVGSGRARMPALRRHHTAYLPGMCSTHSARHAGASNGSDQYAVSRAILPSRNSKMKTAS